MNENRQQNWMIFFRGLLFAGQFPRKYPMNGELKEQEEEIDNPDCNRERTWCDEAEIMFKPTFYMNGYRLQEKYGIEELK